METMAETMLHVLNGYVERVNKQVEEAGGRDVNISLNMSPKLLTELRDVIEDAVDTEKTFDMMWDADMRAIAAWQKETGVEMIWPDREKHTAWMLARGQLLSPKTERNNDP